MATDEDLAHRPRISKPERNTVIAVVAAFLLVLVVWALVTPILDAPDEIAHWDSALRLALGQGWPRPGDAHYLRAALAARDQLATVPTADRSTLAELLSAHPGHAPQIDQMTQHPPTYYALAAGVLHLVGFVGLRWDIGVLALRLLDVVLVAPLPLFVWLTVRRVTRSPRAAVIGALTVFAVPQVAQIGSSVTNDAPVILFGAVSVWLLSRIVTGDRRWSTAVAASLAVGLLMSTKGTGLTAVPIAVFALVWGSPGALSLGRRIVQAVVGAALATAVGGWWWIRNVIDFHTVQPAGLVTPSTRTRPWPHGTSANVGTFFNTEWARITSSFWGQFGQLSFPMTPILIDVLGVGAILLVVAGGFRRGPQLRPVIALSLLPASAILLLLQNNWSTYDRRQIISGAQGRYLFVALAALIAVCAVACQDVLVTARARDRVARVACVAIPAIALYGLSVAYRGFYQGTNLGVTREGLAHLGYVTPPGPRRPGSSPRSGGSRRRSRNRLDLEIRPAPCHAITAAHQRHSLPRERPRPDRSLTR